MHTYIYVHIYIYTLTYTYIDSQWIANRQRPPTLCKHTQTHTRTHTHRDRDRERERETHLLRNLAGRTYCNITLHCTHKCHLQTIQHAIILFTNALTPFTNTCTHTHKPLLQNQASRANDNSEDTETYTQTQTQTQTYTHVHLLRDFADRSNDNSKHHCAN